MLINQLYWLLNPLACFSLRIRCEPHPRRKTNLAALSNGQLACLLAPIAHCFNVLDFKNATIFVLTKVCARPPCRCAGCSSAALFWTTRSRRERMRRQMQTWFYSMTAYVARLQGPHKFKRSRSQSKNSVLACLGGESRARRRFESSRSCDTSRR